MRKTFFAILCFLISVFIFGQNSEYRKAVNLFNQKQYTEANVLVEELLNEKYGSLNNEQKYYCLAINSNCYYFLNDYKTAYVKAEKYLAFVKDNKGMLQDSDRLINDINKYISDLKVKIPNETNVSQSSANSVTNTNGQATEKAKASSDDKTITLTVTGSGKTIEEAKTNALRSAIEQAFGAFISSKTEVLNDALIKDEVVSISNGNIQKFDVVSQVEIPNNGYAITLNAIVSVSKLTSFVESKGVTVDFKGGLFAFNISQQALNEENEIKAINDMCGIVKQLSDIAFDYKIIAGDPVSKDGGNQNWNVPLQVNVYVNDNFFKITSYIFKTLKSLSLSKGEAENYIKLGKGIAPITMAINEKEYDYFILRKGESKKRLIEQLYYFNYSILNFKISNGITEFYGTDEIKLKSLNDEMFKFRICSYADYNYFSHGVLSDHIRRPILNYNKFEVRNLYQSGFSYSFEKNINDIDIYEILAESDIPHGNLFNFLKDSGLAFKMKFLINDEVRVMTGELMSFSNIKPNSQIVTINYEDALSLDDIKRIQEYKVIPLNR